MLKKLRMKYAPYWQLYVFLLLPVAYILIFAYWPMFGLQIAFKKFSIVTGVWDSPWVGLKNFTKFFNAYQFTNIMYNTLSLSIYAILAAFPFPILFALMLNTIEHEKLKKTVQTITYMPHFISTVVIVAMLMQLFHPMNGLYGKLMQALTGQMPADLFAQPSAFPHLYVWSGVWQGFGYNSIIYLAAIAGIDESLYEAAMVDGANRFQSALHITLPSLMSTFIVVLLLQIGSFMSAGFDQYFAFSNIMVQSKLEVIDLYTYRIGMKTMDYSFATAISILQSIVSVALLMLVNGFSRLTRGEGII